MSKVFSLKGVARLGDISGYAFLIHQMAIWYVGLAVSKLNYTKYMGAGIKVSVAFIITMFLATIYELVMKYYNKKDM